MATWSIVKPTSLFHRPHINRGGEGQFGGLEFTASPDFRIRLVAVELRDSSEESKKWFPDVIAGFERYQAERRRAGRPVGAVRVAITKLHPHPGDTSSPMMTRLARDAFAQMFEKYESLVEDA